MELYTKLMYKIYNKNTFLIFYVFNGGFMKNIIITGGANGIGYYLVKQLILDGFNVTVLDLNVDSFNNMMSESLLPLICNVMDYEQIKVSIRESVNKYGSVDCVIHNACMCTFDSMQNTDVKTYHDVFEVNYFGALYLAKAALPYMKKQQNGKVIFTSSGVGVMGFINISPYASSKGAIESLAKCLNIEYQNERITFHIFHPPLTRTKSSSYLPVPKEFMASPEDVGKGLAKHINKNSFIICHSYIQKIQTLMCYLFPIKMGKLMSKLTSNYVKEQK